MIAAEWTLVDVFISGASKTKGSMTVRPNKSLANSDASSHWRAIMAGALRDDYFARMTPPTARPAGGKPGPWVGAVRVRADFWLPGDPLAYGAGDLDKLLRNLLDAMGTTSKNPRYNGGVIADDNQVTQIISDKGCWRDEACRFAGPGVHVVVTGLA